jgi:nucleotide-binding universal stress UspA family protein
MKAPSMYRNILVAIDGSPASALALKKAIELAAITKARLCLFHALDELSISTALDSSRSYVGNWKAVLLQEGQAFLDEAAAKARQAGIETETCLQDGFAGPVHMEIAEKAKAWGGGPDCGRHTRPPRHPAAVSGELRRADPAPCLDTSLAVQNARVRRYGPDQRVVEPAFTVKHHRIKRGLGSRDASAA